MIVEGQAELREVVGAGASPPGLSSALHGRQEQADKHPDDRDHDQELHKGEAMSAGLSAGWWSRGGV